MNTFDKTNIWCSLKKSFSHIIVSNFPEASVSWPI